MTMLASTCCSIALFALLACASDEKREPNDYWRSGPTVPVAAGLDGRFEAYAASDGERLYLIGGIVGSGTDIRVAEPTAAVHVLERGASTWREGPQLPAASAKHHLTVAVLDGEIYVLGGFDGIIGRGVEGDEFRPVAATFVLRGETWTRLSDPPLARGGATAQSLGGKIHVVGGTRTEGQPPFADHYAFDPKANTWVTRAPLPTPREHLASCALGDKMLVVGGWVGPDNVAQGAAELYDPATDSWSRVADMPTRRGGLAAVARGNACHVLGGEDWKLPPPGTFAVHEVFDANAGTWSIKAPMPQALHGIGVSLHHDLIWLVGGGPIQGNSYVKDVSIYAP